MTHDRPRLRRPPEGTRSIDDEVTVYTPKTLADRWHCSESTIRRLVEKGELKAFRLGGRILRIKAEWVEEFEQCNATVEPPAPGSPSPPGKTESESERRSKILTRARVNVLRQR